MLDGIEYTLLTEKHLKDRVREIGKQITEDYKDEKSIIAVGILKGSVVFLADLIREIGIHTELEFMVVSSYGASTVTSGNIKILKDLDIDINGQNVLIVEDIIDSGVTLSNLKSLLEKRNPKSLKICTLLNKPDRRKAEVDVSYSGFVIPDEFVVGYGLDYANLYRNLPFIGVLKKSVYSK